MNPLDGYLPLHFEVYLVVSMKFGMINREAELESKLSAQGLSFGEAEHIHRRVAGLFAHADSQFETLKRLIGTTNEDARSVSFNGVLWPEFEFTATGDAGGSLESAQYTRASGRPEVANSPVEQPPWSMDCSEFGETFGPTVLTYRSPMFDPVLPAHEMREFTWAGRKYGAGFSWGLFLFASKLWT